MPISTPLTALLQVRHPILLAPMDLVADGRLAAEVSRAGGLGLIGGGYGDEAWLARELDAAGDARVGVGFITWSMAKRPRVLEMALERRPAAVMLSFGEVAPHAARIKQAGAALVCQVQTVEQARAAAGAGADLLVAQGGEAGGHGMSRGTLALVPAVVDAVGDLPVAAAGGIADGRGLAAALMLGAAGVLVGTRFYASEEAAGHGAAKQRLVAGSGDRTIRSILFDIARGNVWPAPYTGRLLRNEFSERWRGREAELMQHQEAEAARYAAARAAGDFDVAGVIAGEAVDLVTDIPPAAEIVARMVREAETLLRGASNRYRVTKTQEETA
ncbi:MAG TPA: nitronate monooxygenase [Stellaceae bacterium]|nr:nitronate monooxygenase [Stellaceae bacterium]